jgi:hypothetical protein
MIEPWDEPDEARYSEGEARRKLVQREIRRRTKRDSKRRRQHRLEIGALKRGSPPRTNVLSVEWSFIETKLHEDVLLPIDRLESGSLNESDGGEECEAILTALSRAERRTARPVVAVEGKGGEDVEMAEAERDAGKREPQLTVTVNGH